MRTLEQKTERDQWNNAYDEGAAAQAKREHDIGIHTILFNYEHERAERVVPAIVNPHRHGTIEHDGWSLGATVY